MKRWLAERKIIMILLGVVYLILALFIVSSFIGAKGLYVDEHREELVQQTDESGELIVKENVEHLPLSLDTRGNIEVLASMVQNIGNVGDNFKYMFTYFGDYLGALGSFTKFYLVAFVVLLVLYKPGKEYEKIEHGSADWASGGEQYKVLSKTEGFILAKDHFLPMIPSPPTGKNGNILVIRRFWFW